MPLKNLLTSLFTLLFLASTSSFAQNALPETSSLHSFYLKENSSLRFLRKGRWLGANSSLESQSRNLSNQFLSPFFFGGHLDAELKFENFNQLDSYNWLSASGAAKAYASIPLKGNIKAENLFFEIGASSLMQSHYSKTLFEGLFFGNGAYEGKTMNLGSFYSRQLDFQELKAGMIFSGPEKTNYGFALHFLSGSKFREIKGENGVLTTDSLASSLQLDFEINMQSTIQEDQNYSSPKGYGGGLSFFGYKQIKNAGVFGIEIDGLSWISWNKNSRYLDLDTSYLFQGLVIDELSFLKDSNYLSDQMDTMKNEYLPQGMSGPFTSFVSPRIKLIWSYEPGNDWELYTEAYYRPGVHALPGINASVLRYFKNFYSLINLGFDGQTWMKYGLGAGYRNEKIFIQINSTNFTGLMAPSLSGSNHLGLLFGINLN